MRASLERPLATAEALRQPEDAGAAREDERDDDELLAEERVDRSPRARGPRSAAGMTLAQQHEGEPALRVARRDCARAWQPRPAPDEVEDVAPEVGQQRRERAHVKHDDERRRC